jgi:hypothetical protein
LLWFCMHFYYFWRVDIAEFVIIVGPGMLEGPAHEQLPTELDRYRVGGIEPPG